jgi:hemolysin-activating ACP:hemolysin acyltransferase
MASTQEVFDGIYLFSHTEFANEVSVAEFCTDYINPLTTGHAKLYYAEKPNGIMGPAGLTTWCWFTNEEAQAFKAGEFNPTLEDYRRESGDQLWGIWMLAPFGHLRQVWRQMSDHCQKLYGPQKVHWLRVNKETPEKIHRGRM